MSQVSTLADAHQYILLWLHIAMQHLVVLF